MKPKQRTPRNYDGTQVTTHRMADLLPQVLSALSEVQHYRPDLVLAAWPEVIGAKLAGMTEALSFVDGVLLVKVKNSTLYSLLNQYERPRILRNLQAKFPSVRFEKIIFRVG
jgi:hypothetical protein